MRFSEYVYKTYHRILLEQLIAQHAYHISGSMLDVGALNPRYNHLFKATVTSVDIIVNETLGVSYGDIEKGLTFPDASFDSVICIEVFEYLDDYQRAINEYIPPAKTGRESIYQCTVRLPGSYGQYPFYGKDAYQEAGEV